jgi:hypothetical protein
LLWRIRLVIVGRFVISGERVLKDRDLSSVFFFELVGLYEVSVKVWGTTGHTSGFSTFRGKPRDTGCRQRFMGFTITWADIDGAWRIEGASPI